MSNSRFKKSFSVFLSLLMTLTTLAVGFVPITVKAAVDSNYGMIPSDTLLAKFFSNDWVWYDAATGHNQLAWKVNGYPEYQSGEGMTYLNNLYLQINTKNLFAGVSSDTGLTFSYTYKPQIGDNHRHVLSLGANEYSGNGINASNHFYISATKSWMGGEIPFVGYVDSNGTQHINARPEDGCPAFETGTIYNVVVTVSATTGITFNINGTDYAAVYYNSDFEHEKDFISEFLNAVSSYQYNYIGVSRWGDGYFTGYFKDLCIYGSAYTKAQLDISSVPYSDAFISEAKTNFNVDNLNASNAVFNAQPYHQADPIDVYSNYVYSDGTSWSGDGLGNTGWGVGRTSFKIAVPLNNVLVYDGVHDVIAPVTLESWSNDTSGQSQIIKYVTQNTDLFSLQQNWQGYGTDWTLWSKTHITTAESFSHLRDTDPESPATQRDGASRFWWNKLKYNGSGNTTTYFDADYNIQYHAKTAYRNSASTSHDFREGDITSLANYYVINYQPVYSILSEAAAFYNANIAGQEWKYTDASLNQAMVALYLIQECNPNNFDYSVTTGEAVRKCASTIKQAVAEYAKINLVKKTGTVTFNNEDGSLYQSFTKDYGDSFTVPAVPAKSSTAQYDYINPVWLPGVLAGDSLVMSDTYKDNVYTASYTPSLRSYDITWSFMTADGQQSETVTENYGVTPTAPAGAEDGYQTAERVYTFSNWSPAVSSVTGEKTYTAQYTDTARTYQVKFFDLDENQIGETQVVAYNAAANAPLLPTKAYTDDNHFIITWDKTFDHVTGDLNVYATAAAEAHSYQYTSNNDGTCVSNGTRNGVCACGKTVENVADPDSIIPSNHPAASLENRDPVAATCMQGGYTAGVYCTACENWVSGHEPTAVDENAHDYSDFVPFDDTYHYVYCKYNHSHLQGLAEHDYIIDEERSFAATCTTDGQNVEVCSACGNEKTTVLNAGGHDWSGWTDNGDGTHSRTCSHDYCAADEKTETVPHNYVFSEELSTPATCVSTGTAVSVCVCGAQTSATAEVLAHSYGEWIEQVNATCSTEGVKGHYECSSCHQYFDSEYNLITDLTINKNDNHVHTHTTEAVTANCVTEGFTAGVYCDDCKQYISGHASQGFDYVNGHAYGSFEPNGDGTHSKRCTREGCTDAVANHTVTETCAGGTATCTEKAECAVCGGEYGEALGHNWNVSFTWDDTVTPPTAKAAFVCANNADHNVTVDATVTEIASNAAHCGEPGSVTYRASCVMDGVTYATDEATDKTVTTDSLPHLWKAASWAWSDDHRTVTLNLICERDGGHTHQIVSIPASVVLVSEATCTEDKVVKYTASAEYEGYTFETASDEITLEGTALGHTYEFVGWTWADDYKSASAKFVCAADACDDTVFVSVDVIDETVITAPDCEKNKVVTYTASVEFKLTKNGEVQTFTDTTDAITLENTKTAHAWGEATYTWNGTESVTAKRVCGNYASHVEEETVRPAYAVTTDPTYTEQGEGTYTAAFTNPAFKTQTYTEAIACIKEQIESALGESGSGIADIDALIETAKKIVNGEDPFTAPYEDSYVDALSDLLDEFEDGKNDPSKADTLAGTLEEIKSLVDAHEDHIVYTVTYVLNGGSAENKTAFVRTEAAFTLNNPTKSGYVFVGWTGTGLAGATLTVTVDPADAENKTFTATWTVDNTEAETAIGNAAALIEDAADEYEDAYSDALADLVAQLENALAADPQDAAAIRTLVDQVNAKIADAANNKHSFTVPAGYKEGYEPTCTESGIGVKKCENCEKTQEFIVKALGHDWGEWIVDVPADYGVDGHAHRTCARCGENENKTLTLSAEYDRQIRFNVIPKMHYVIEVGDGFAVFNTNTILWYSASELHFHVYTYTNSGYGDNYTVYINGKAATPDENGSYTLPAGSTNDTVSISVNNSPVTPSQPGSGNDGTSGTCAYCGKVHTNNLWGRIIALFHAIFAFFRDLFKR